MSNGALVPPPTTVPPSPFTEPDQVRKPLSGRDWVAICFAAAILVLIAMVLIFVLTEWHAQSPSLSQIPLADRKTAIDSYKELAGVLADRAEKMFDLTVTKALLPVFATIVGFLLGKRSKEE